MTRKLNDVDRNAVDLMFNRITATAGNGNGGDGFVAVAGGISQERLQSVEQILKPLEQMPASEPPADLTVRTLQFIARRTGTSQTVPTGAAATAFIDPTQPMA